MMQSIKQEALVKGNFTADQAKEVLTTLFRSKIQMHNILSFGSLVRTGSESAEDNDRKKELAESLDRLLKVIKANADQDLYVKLDCMVKMKFVKRKSATKRNVRR
jgi:hypothetical protein